jgi:hypothetical protein
MEEKKKKKRFKTFMKEIGDNTSCNEIIEETFI